MMKEDIFSPSNFHTIDSLPDFTQPKIALEQYVTPAVLLSKYFALIQKNLELFPKEKQIIIDLGCGTGRLTFIALQAGARSVVGIDIDSQALEIAQHYTQEHNISNISWIQTALEFFPMTGFRGKIAGVVMNPPFGTRRQHIDFVFLRKAFATGGWVLSLHKSHPQTLQALQQLVAQHLYALVSIQEVEFPVTASRASHKVAVYPVNVILCCMIPKDLR